jgi:tetratricopeptide (TPR) repeat protein
MSTSRRFERSAVKIVQEAAMKRAMMCVILTSGTLALAQEQQSAQQLFEAGQIEPALQAITRAREIGAAGPAEAFLAGHILLKTNQIDGARAEFQGLAQSDDEAWRLIGGSAIAGLDGDMQRAVDAATQASELAPDRFEAHYQLGHVRARVEDWTGSAAALARAVELNPTFAYAHYNAGQAFSRISQVDRTAEHFERFLKLAPLAPERAAVESLMRTLRGR